MGEIGSSLYTILRDEYPVWGYDIKPELCKMGDVSDDFDVMHICIRYSPDYLDQVQQLINRFTPEYVNNCSTVPVFTTKQLRVHGLSGYACHSTTRGLHPNLVTGLRTIKKHIGGPTSEFFKNYFHKVGIECETHPHSHTTELLHILNNVHYGINLMFANEAAALCRRYSVDYYDWMKYCESNNDGYLKLGHKTKVRPILTPPGDKIGGHCVVQSSQLVPEEFRTPMIDLLSKYND